ncbi:hypothetical protein [Cesiribacter sp. SM1]|uniref:hypothetical protein n=1 Tax=Cesiribacter sp. SM1 TaxID=2861196 RepID=UPI001CD1CC57|nr:hypothetical protein [Cesiribacter sp. SM1]
MIKIFPKPEIPPLGHAVALQQPRLEELLFLGIHTLVRQRNREDGADYYYSLPVGYTSFYPVSFCADGSKAQYHPEAADWLAKPLIDSVVQGRGSTVTIEKQVFKQAGRVVILNCLDDCYGHVLVKLFNARQYLEDPALGLVVIIPHIFAWLVPEGVAEVWSVQAPLRALKAVLTNFDAFVKQELSRFSEVYLSPAATSLDYSKTDFSRFIKVPPFAMQHFMEKPAHITFICREDRFWLTSQADAKLYLAAVKFKFLPKVKAYFVHRQNQLFQQVAGLLGQQLKNVSFAIAGFGNSGQFPADFSDMRVQPGTMTEATELAWCRQFASSHAVVGVHGSHMLIPSWLAAGFISLVPPYKIINQAEDVIPRHSAQNQVYLGRFLPTSVSPAIVAQHLAAMIRYFPHHYRIEE